ncbi:MAG TPA: farnesyl diphosphate synthase [Gemmatimonadaceae bacterium]|nr:farnesyl diphosphate synthase [Gemmatimonadaceae bacterium]
MTSAVEPAGLSFDADRAAVDAALAGFGVRALDGIAARVADAIRYTLAGEGKRLRAILTLAAYRACGGARDASALAAAVEVVHAYSLVHDDLPCMDDDDVRRGRATVHRVFGVAAATAAGLAMVPLAVRCAYGAARALGLAPGEAAAVVRELMGASGAAGMIGGQLLDLEGEGGHLSLAELERIHRAKTGALIAAAVRIGGIAARAGAARIAALGRYGEAIGLAFQIADDVLDVTATTHELGKTAGRDLALQKSTYPALLGVEGAIGRAEALVEEGRAALAAAGLATPALDHLARFSIRRRS